MHRYGLMNLGGGVKVALSFYKVLKELGYEVVFYVPTPTNWDVIEKIYGTYIKPSKEVVLPKHVFPFKAYQEQFFQLLARITAHTDVIIDAAGTFVPYATITYIHFPSLLIEKKEKLLLRIYKLPRKILARYSATSSKLILVNSNYTKMFVKKFMGRKAIVLYPPVDVEKYTPYIKKQGRLNMVITIGRFISKKNYEFVIALARKMPNVKFIIIGTLKGKDELKYFKKIKKLAAKFKVRNIILKNNVSWEEKARYLSQAKVYLHAAKGEHFGIAIVEAMAAGCVPVIHKSGGAWIDILEGKQALHGYAYRDLEEAITYIKEVLTNEN